jgi:hypothetical protein
MIRMASRYSNSRGFALPGHIGAIQTGEKPGSLTESLGFGLRHSKRYG